MHSPSEKVTLNYGQGVWVLFDFHGLLIESYIQSEAALEDRLYWPQKSTEQLGAGKTCLWEASSSALIFAGLAKRSLVRNFD